MCSGGDGPDLAAVETTVSMTTVVVVAIVMLVALLIVIDVSCYFVNACGLTMCISVHLCGHQPTTPGTKPISDKDADDPERYAYTVYYFCKVRWQHFTGALYKFITFCCDVSSGFCVSKVTLKINSFLTELLRSKKNRAVIVFF